MILHLIEVLFRDGQCMRESQSCEDASHGTVYVPPVRSVYLSVLRSEATLELEQSLSYSVRLKNMILTNYSLSW